MRWTYIVRFIHIDAFEINFVLKHIIELGGIYLIRGVLISVEPWIEIHDLWLSLCLAWSWYFLCWWILSYIMWAWVSSSSRFFEKFPRLADFRFRSSIDTSLGITMVYSLAATVFSWNITSRFSIFVSSTHGAILNRSLLFNLNLLRSLLTFDSKIIEILGWLTVLMDSLIRHMNCLFRASLSTLSSKGTWIVNIDTHLGLQCSKLSLLINILALNIHQSIASLVQRRAFLILVWGHYPRSSSITSLLIAMTSQLSVFHLNI